MIEEEIEILELTKRILEGKYQDEPNEYEMEKTALKGINNMLSHENRKSKNGN